MFQVSLHITLEQFSFTALLNILFLHGAFRIQSLAKMAYPSGGVKLYIPRVSGSVEFKDIEDLTVEHRKSLDHSARSSDSMV